MRSAAKASGALIRARSWRRLGSIAHPLARLSRRTSSEQGFTVVEVIVATLVMTIGLLTVFLMLVITVHSSSQVRQREEAISLARQITEDARSIPYSQLASNTITTELQAMPNLANQGSGSSWMLKRGGWWFTVSATETSLNDPKDTSGGIDIKQVAVTVNWSTFQGTTHQYTETAVMSRAGEDPGLAASGLGLYSPACNTAGIVASSCPGSPVVTSTGITSLQFSVTAPSGTNAIVWTLNGVKQPSWNGSAPTSGTTWISTAWSLSGVSDGTYTVGAQAEDTNGVDGPAQTISVRLIRNVPSAPVVTGYGYNTNLPGGPATVAEFQWNPNPELNVVGYRIYNPSGTLVCETDATASFPAACGGGNGWCSSLTACVDLSPPSPSSSTRTYTIKALYYDVNNNLQEGNPTSVTLAAGTPTSPGAPTGLNVVENADASATLTWTPPVGGATVSFYRIYRDGATYTSRYDTLPASSCSITCTYHDTARTTPHTYYVSAVGGTTLGSDMAESPLSAGKSG